MSGYSWHRWFAWRPVRTIDGRRTWFRCIYRRLWFFPEGLPGAPGPMWEYQRTDRYADGLTGLRP